MLEVADDHITTYKYGNIASSIGMHYKNKFSVVVIPNAGMDILKKVIK